jgi:hypothetical protein
MHTDTPQEQSRCKALAVFLPRVIPFRYISGYAAGRRTRPAVLLSAYIQAYMEATSDVATGAAS